MAVSFEDIEDKFDRIFGYIRRDLERILELEVGGNFAVALLITCACQTLAKFRHGGSEGYKVFRDLLPGDPYKAAAKPLYNVLRNGLVHRYDAPDIRFDGQTLRFAIAWRESRHLSIKQIDSVPNLVLNVRKICEELFSAFDKYQDQLRQKSEARNSFLKRHGEEDEQVTDCNQIRALQKIVNHAPEAEA